MSHLQSPPACALLGGLLALICFSGSTPIPKAPPALPDLDRALGAIAARTPPIAFGVVVVRGDSAIHLAGYGLRDRARALPVTPSTAFYIASSTKSFVALTAALLAERGVVDLDAPLGTIVPEFRLPAPMDGSRVTLRRLLSHRGGFDSDAVSFRTAFAGNLGRDSLLAVLARTASPVDTHFTYTNVQYIVAARALERATRTAWQDLVAREVVRPLGLTHTTALASEATSWERAEGWALGPTGYWRVAPKTDATMHAAGGMLMSAEDAGRWLIAQLNGGRVVGRSVFPQPVVAGTHAVNARQESRFDGIQRFGYGLGWQLGIEAGDTLLHHFGNYPGAFAHVSFVPSKRIGVAVFMNSELPAFGRAAGHIAQLAYDVALGRGDGMKGAEAHPESLAAGVARMENIFRQDAARRAARPRVPERGWRAFEGAFEARDWGRLDIVALADTAAELRFGVIRTRLEVLHGDTLRVEPISGRGGVRAPVTFAGGRAQAITIEDVTYHRGRLSLPRD